MTAFIFDQVLWIDGAGLDGLYRVLAVSHQHRRVHLAKLPQEQKELSGKSIPIVTASLDELLDLETHEGYVRAINIIPSARRCTRPDQLSSASQKIFSRRRAAFDVISKPGGFDRAFDVDHPRACLVKTICRATGMSRSDGHRLLNRLLLHGFNGGSLYPDLDNCGARGVSRPTDHRRRSGRKANAQRIGADEAFEQRGLTTVDRTRILVVYRAIPEPKPAMTKIYQQILLKLYATDFKETADGLVPVLPPAGTYPNQQQVERVIRTQTSPIQLALDRTTKGHFQRNYRAMKGFMYQDVAGPGHCYAIDSTIGDIGLRSSINRAWRVGRPVVYLLVDVWSGAVVGFYVCLQGPSWRTAKLSIFSASAPAGLLGELWGYVPVLGLDPEPSLPAMLLCDRGEYLSKAAEESMRALGVTMAYNPSYRPDMKGIVEVFHRISKDNQFRFIPGAIDRRRKELENRPASQDGVFTVREYVQYLYLFFQYENRHREVRRRLTSEMIADGVAPTPESMWAWGHQVGIGYRRAHAFELLASHLLNPAPAKVTPKGVYLGLLNYQSDFIESRQWTGLARLQGSWDIELLQYPGSLARTWWLDRTGGGVHSLALAPTALTTPDVSLDEWVDATVYSSRTRGLRLHERAQGGVAMLHAAQELRDRAIHLTRDAEQREDGRSLPPLRAVRQVESVLGESSLLCSPIVEQAERVAASTDADYESSYLELINQVVNDAA